MADKLLLPGRKDPKTDVLQLVHDWLSDGRHGRWLIVLDNIDDDGVFFGDGQGGAHSSQAVDAAEQCRPLESFLPQQAHGTILITCRNTVAATNLAGGHGGVVEVEPMGEEDALQLLHTRVPFAEATRADAKALVHALERIPLAIIHAAAYIKTRASTTTIATYLNLFRESEASQVHLLSRKEWKDIQHDHSIRHAVIATWQISFQHIQATVRSAADLLALMSMFDKQGIPRWLLQGTTGQLDFNDALAPLLSFSFVKTEVGEQALAMHQLVQLLMRRWLEAESELGKWVTESIRALSAAFPSGDYQTWEACKVLLPHLKEVGSHRTEDREDLMSQAQTSLSAGWYLFLKGEYTAAEGFCRSSLDIREKVLGRKHPDTLTSVSKLGSVLERQGKYDEAEAIHRRALEGDRVLGPEHPHMLTSISYLGTVLERQGKYKEAEAMHRQALEGQEKALGREHLHTLISVSKLGSVLERQGKYDEAEAMHHRALEGLEKVLGREHPHTLTSISYLGTVLERQRKYDEAEAMHRRALEGSEKALGREHLDTLTSISYLGTVLERQGKYKEAEAMHRQVLEGREKVLGHEHPHTLTSVSKLGLVLERLGKYEEAEAMHRRALEGDEKVLGPEHPDTLTTVYCLAYLLIAQHRYNESLALFVRACVGYETVLGKDHPTTHACYHHYAGALVLQEQDQSVIPSMIPDGSPIARTEKRSKPRHVLANTATQKAALEPVRVSSMGGVLLRVGGESTSNDVLDYPKQRGLPHDKHEEQQVYGAESTRGNSAIHHGQRHRGVVSAPLDLPELMPDNLEYREVYGSGPVWTYTSAEDISIENIPLRISGHPVVVPVEYRHPAAAYTIPPPDPRHLFIDASIDVSEDIINDIFETYNDIVGFYLLINGMLQLIIPDDFDINNALSRKPNEFGGLKVSYIYQSIIPTAESQEGTFSGSLQVPSDVETAASQRTRPSHPLQVSNNTNVSSEQGKSRGSSMDLKIGSMVHACLEGLKAADRFQGKIGLMTESNGQNHMVMPTHVLTQALMATKSDRFPGDQWKEDMVVVASNGGREV